MSYSSESDKSLTRCIYVWCFLWWVGRRCVPIFKIWCDSIVLFRYFEDVWRCVCTNGLATLVLSPLRTSARVTLPTEAYLRDLCVGVFQRALPRKHRYMLFVPLTPRFSSCECLSKRQEKQNLTVCSLSVRVWGNLMERVVRMMNLVLRCPSLFVVHDF